jgi:hypothetical protein
MRRAPDRKALYQEDPFGSDKVPLGRYFLFAGSVIVAMLFMADWYYHAHPLKLSIEEREQSANFFDHLEDTEPASCSRSWSLPYLTARPIAQTFVSVAGRHFAGLAQCLS